MQMPSRQEILLISRPSCQCQIKTVRLGYPWKDLYTRKEDHKSRTNLVVCIRVEISAKHWWTMTTTPLFFLDPKNLIAKNTKPDLEVVLEWKRVPEMSKWSLSGSAPCQQVCHPLASATLRQVSRLCQLYFELNMLNIRSPKKSWIWGGQELLW